VTHATGWLIAAIVLASAACARVQSHYELAALAAEDRSFLPTIEADYAKWQSRGFFNRLLEFLSLPVRQEM
jgi:hypothetical protein